MLSLSSSRSQCFCNDAVNGVKPQYLEVVRCEWAWKIMRFWHKNYRHVGELLHSEGTRGHLLGFCRLHVVAFKPLLRCPWLLVPHKLFRLERLLHLCTHVSKVYLSSWVIEDVIAKSRNTSSIFKSSGCIRSWICACINMYICRERKRLESLNRVTPYQNLILHTTSDDKSNTIS